MAPIEGRVAKPERQWDCCHGTPNKKNTSDSMTLINSWVTRGNKFLCGTVFNVCDCINETLWHWGNKFLCETVFNICDCIKETLWHWGNKFMCETVFNVCDCINETLWHWGNKFLCETVFNVCDCINETWWHCLTTDGYNIMIVIRKLLYRR